MNLEGKNLNQRTSVVLNPTVNIWQDILRESMSKKDLEESNVFIFGDKFTGKRSLIKLINKEILQKNEFEEQKKILGTDDSGSKYSLIDYTYLGVKKYNEYDSGKNYLNNVKLQNNSYNYIFIILLYKFNLKSSFNSESIGKINIWLANDFIEKEVFQAVIKPENITNSVCVIVVDLSRVTFFFIFSLGKLWIL